jgi:hypothetical protein
MDVELKNDWTGGPPGLAQFLNTIADQLLGAEIVTGGTVTLSELGLRFEIAPETAGATFDFTLAGSTVTVHPGALRMHGLGIHALAADTDVVLSGATEWVYLELARSDQKGTTAPTVAHSATEPETTSTHLRIPLYKFTATAGVYSLVMRCNVGDINLDAPV